jgi:hypothetical protein
MILISAKRMLRHVPWLLVAASVSSASAQVAVTTTHPAGRSVHTRFISPAGTDSNPCSRALPCLSFARVYATSGPGDLVKIAPGQYGAQTLPTDNARLDARRPLTFEGGTGRSLGTVVVEQLNLTGASNLIFKNMTLGTGSPRNRAWYQRFSSHTLCDRCSIHGQLVIDGDDSQIAFDNGEVCCYEAGDSDPQIGAERGANAPDAVQPYNVSFVNESFHDINSTSLATHTECLQVLAVHGLEVERSKFYRCNVNGNGSKAGILFSGFDCQGSATTPAAKESNCGTNDDYWNVTIESSMFNAGLTPPQGGNFLAFQWDDQFGDPNDCRNILVRHNSVIGGVLWGCDSPAETVVRGNIFSMGLRSRRPQCNGIFSYNIWEQGVACRGRHGYVHRVKYVSREAGPAFDLHLKPGSFGIGLEGPRRGDLGVGEAHP